MNPSYKQSVMTAHLSLLANRYIPYHRCTLLSISWGSKLVVECMRNGIFRISYRQAAESGDVFGAPSIDNMSYNQAGFPL